VGQVSWAAYNAARGETHPAVGDVDGDGIADIVLGLGRRQGFVEIVNYTATGAQSRAWLQVGWTAYNNANGATFPAVGDLDGTAARRSWSAWAWAARAFSSCLGMRR